MTLIKICGIKDPALAYSAAKAGADLIGIMQYPHSSRYVSLELGQEIAYAALEGGAIPVAVFYQQSEIEIRCQQLGVESYQIENRISVQQKAYFLMDASLGTGQTLDWSKVISPQKLWFLAGGLTPENVGTALQRLQPNGVDVSSGVESLGQKDLTKIQQFIDEVKKYG